MKVTAFGFRFVLLLAACLCASGSQAVIRIHRSFRPREVGFGGVNGNFGVIRPVDGRIADAVDRKRAAESEREFSLVGKVTSVRSASEVVVTPNGGRRHDVRLERISVPTDDGEASSAAEALKGLILGKTVTVSYLKSASVGDTIVGTLRLKHGGKAFVDINLTLIKNGYVRYQGTAETERGRVYAAAESDARANRRGIWAK